MGLPSLQAPATRVDSRPAAAVLTGAHQLTELPVSVIVYTGECTGHAMRPTRWRDACRPPVRPTVGLGGRPP